MGYLELWVDTRTGALTYVDSLLALENQPSAELELPEFEDGDYVFKWMPDDPSPSIVWDLASKMPSIADRFTFDHEVFDRNKGVARFGVESRSESEMVALADDCIGYYSNEGARSGSAGSPLQNTLQCSLPRVVRNQGSASRCSWANGRKGRAVMDINRIDMQGFGTRLGLWLYAKDMTQAQLAAYTGLSASSICDYVSGKRLPRLAALIAIASTLNTSVEDLLEGVERPLPCLDEAVHAICRAPHLLSAEHRVALAEAIMTTSKPR